MTDYSEVDKTVEELIQTYVPDSPEATIVALEEKMAEAPVVHVPENPIAPVEAKSDAIKKAAYYAVFAKNDNPAAAISDGVEALFIARYETKKEIKDIIKSLEDKGLFDKMKLIDIIKGRPLNFKINKKIIQDLIIED